MLTFVVSNICHSDNLDYQYLLNKLSATIKNKPVLLFVILANKYGITTYFNFLSIDNFCTVKFKLLWLSKLPWILDKKLSATKTKDNQF